MDSLAPHRTVVALTLDEPRLHTRRTRLVVLMGLGVMLLVFALMAVSASAAQAYTVSGTVTAQATGFGIAEATVTVTEPATGIKVASTITNLAGNYSLEVPAGTYDISFTPPVGSGYTSVEDRGEAVLTNRTIDVEFAPLSGSVTFSGVLYGEGGVPLPGVAMILEAGGGSSVTKTASDGSFSLTVAPGTYSMTLEGGSLSVGGAQGSFSFLAQSVTISGNLHEDLTLPVHMLTVRVLEANGNPVSGVSVSGGGSSAIAEGALGPGIAVSEGGVFESATTGADGTAVFSVPDFTGNQTFQVRPPENTPLVSTTLSITGVNEDQTREVKLPAGVTFSGVLYGEGGVPLPGVAMILEAGGGSSVTKTASDGSFSLTVAPGTYSMTLEGGSLSVGGAQGSFSFLAQSVTISGNLHEDLTLPVHMLTVRVLEANGNPVSGVSVSGGGSSAIAEGALGPGIAVSEGGVFESATTGADGTAVFSVPDFTGNQTFQVRPPENTPLVSTTLSITGVNEDQTRVIAYPYYARVTSAGTSAGTVEIASPPETTLSAVSDEPVAKEGLPEGAVAVVGSVSYTVSGLTPGGSINVTMQLPPGSEPTNVFKLINGSYVDVTSLATISGNTITLHLTDGGLGDADGVANGVIVDPVVPVHITKHAQAISFSSTAPSSPNIGSVYVMAASATSGLPVSFSIDGSSTAGACSVSAGTVSFTGAGTCVIDANQAGNGTYLSAPQKQQTVEVVKDSQTISFTSTAPTKPAIGGKYKVEATAGSGLPVSFSIDGSSTAGACSVSAGTVSFTGAGTCVIDANQAGNGTYLPAPQKQQTVEVVKASQTITFTSTPPSPAIFGGTYTPSATGGASGNPVTFSIDPSSGSGACSISAGTVSFTGVGLCVIDANQAGSANYVPAPEVQQSFSITKASQTITFTSTPPSPALFGGTYTPSATGGASGNPVTFSIDSSSTAGACWILNGKVSFIGPGSCVVDANQAGNANYNAAPKKQQSFSIGFSKTLSGGISGSLTVSSGQAVYLSPGTTVGGSVTVQAGGALIAQGAKIGSSIYAAGATAVRLCASTIGGAVSITKTTGLIIAGDNDGAVACAGNKVGGAVGISGNYGGVEFDANAVGGSLAITGNAGTLPPPDSGTVDAVGNKVGGGVQIQS
jgi:hypothetical protein